MRRECAPAPTMSPSNATSQREPPKPQATGTRYTYTPQCTWTTLDRKRIRPKRPERAYKGTSQIRAEIHGKGSPLKMANAVDHVRIRDIAGQPEVSRTNVRFLWTEPCLLRMPTFPARA